MSQAQPTFQEFFGLTEAEEEAFIEASEIAAEGGLESEEDSSETSEKE